MYLANKSVSKAETSNTLLFFIKNTDFMYDTKAR